MRAHTHCHARANTVSRSVALVRSGSLTRMKTQVLSAFDRDDVSGLSVKLSGAEYMLSIQGGTRDDAANSHTNDALDEVHAPASPSLSKATLDPLRLGALVTNVRLCALFLCTQESERERERERREREREGVCVRENLPARTCTLTPRAQNACRPGCLHQNASPTRACRSSRTFGPLACLRGSYTPTPPLRHCRHLPHTPTKVRRVSQHACTTACTTCTGWSVGAPAR